MKSIPHSTTSSLGTQNQSTRGNNSVSFFENSNTDGKHFFNRGISASQNQNFSVPKSSGHTAHKGSSNHIMKASSSKTGGSRTPIPSIIVKRKNIHLAGEDKYGHWWTEIASGGESYGWWPKYPVGFWGTLTGVDGELNGQTSFGGSPTRDPHHGDSAEETFSVECTDPSKTPAAIEGEIRAFAASYSGEWRWTFGWGQNCRTFQTALLSNSNLVTS